MFIRTHFFILLLGLTMVSLSGSWAGESSTPEEQKKVALFIKGAKLWPNYCGNCHNLRGPYDRSPGDWEVVMMHMRATANLPPDVAEAILEFLKRR